MKFTTWFEDIMTRNARSALAALTLFAAGGAAQAQEVPFTGLLFAAWDNDVSYTIGLGETISSFDPATPQTFALPDLTTTFADLNAVSFSVIAADNTDLFSGFPSLLMTGTVGPLLTDGLNDGSELGVFADSANNFRTNNNITCGNAFPCTAVFGDPNYAGQLTYGDNLGGSPDSLSVSGNLTTDSLPFLLLEGENFNFDSITVTAQAFAFSFDGTNLVYGEAGVIPLPAAGWLMLSGILGMVGLRRRARAS
jgi:hypothetical protein